MSRGPPIRAATPRKNAIERILTAEEREHLEAVLQDCEDTLRCGTGHLNADKAGHREEPP